MEKPTPAKRAKQKRNRIITACFDCRERKAGCDRKKPICSRCQDGRICIYLDPPNKALINGESRKVSSLPGDIKDKVSRLYSQCLGDAKDGGDQSDYEELEATPLVTESASYDDDVDETEVTDLGFRVGKLHLTDRIGGQYRPKVAQEFQMLLQSTGHQREWSEEQALYSTDLSTFEAGIRSPTQRFLQPSDKYLAPNLDLLSVSSTNELMSFLPPLQISYRILQQYWTSVHPIVRILHRPSFEKRWQVFAENLSSRTRPVKSLQALVFSVLFSGIVAMPPGTLDRELGEDQHLWMANLKTGTEIALGQAQMLQTAKVETLQAFVAYLLVLCRDEVSRIHSSLIAAAIRIAECNGLHVDGEQRGYNAIETHVRRLIWFNLGLLDIRLAEAQGPRPIIRIEDFETKLPANINDADLSMEAQTEAPEGQWTEMTVPLIRFRCNEFIRRIWVNRRKLMARVMSVTPILDEIESFRLEWSLKFAPSKPDDPLQRYGRCLLDIQTLRTYAMVLNIFHLHPKLRMPERLLSILIENGIKTMDRVIELETSEAYVEWRWYAGAIQQHHYALLLAVEILMNPRRKDSDRIWKGLSYVFEPPPLPPIARARWVISQAWWRMEVYLAKRSLRVPMNIEQNLREALKVSTHHRQRDERQSNTSSDTLSFHESSPEPRSADNEYKHKNPFSDMPGTDSLRSDRWSSTQAQRVHAISPSRVYGNKAQAHAQTGTQRQEPPKQVLDVDWGVLNNYYPPEHFTGDLDVPFETWSDSLQSTLYPAVSEHGSLSYDVNKRHSFQSKNNPSTFHAPDRINTQQWDDMWSQPQVQSTQASGFGASYEPSLSTHVPEAATWNDGFSMQAPVAPSNEQPLQQSYNGPQGGPARPAAWNFGTAPDSAAQTKTITPEERRRQNNELNFGMGIYQPIPRQR